MKKWLDTLPSGYVDWTGAMVTGAGTVKAERPKDLPQFDNFTGTLEISASSLSFTLDGTTKTVADAIDIGGATLALADEGTVSLVFANGKVRGGVYTLATFGALAAPGVSGWTASVDGYPATKVRLSVENGALKATVGTVGTTIIFR